MDSAGAGVVVNMLLHVVNILEYVELGLAIIPEDKLALTTHSNGIGQETSQVFPKYSLCTIHMENVKQRLQLLD